MEDIFSTSNTIKVQIGPYERLFEKHVIGFIS
jgi:hypothetical protein